MLLAIILNCAISFAQGGEDCATATAIPDIPYCNIGTTNGYAADYFNSCNGSGSDVVYQFTAHLNQTVRFSLCGSNFDCVLSLWRGCPDAGGDEIICNDDFCGSSSCVTSMLTAGEIYYLIINGYDGSAGNYRFHAVPGNFPCPGTVCGDQHDLCSQAAFITPGSEFPNVFAGSTIGATTDNPPVTPNCVTPAGPGVWFQFTGMDSTVTLSLTGLSTPHQLFAFCGPCTDLTCIASPDCGVFQTTTFCTDLGAQYFVLVAACSDAAGVFDLNATFNVFCTEAVCTGEPPNPPLALTIARSWPNIVLRWNPPVGTPPMQYKVYRSADLNSIIEPPNQIGTTTSTTFTDTNILEAVQPRFYYAVTAETP